MLTYDPELYRRRLDRLRARIIGDVEGAGAPFAEDSFCAEWAIGLLDNDGNILAEIDAALERLDDGTYGHCEKCAEPLRPERLHAEPYLRHCDPCAHLLDAARARD